MKNNEEQNQGKTNINWYPGHMAKTKRLISENLNFIDVVYEVIDARIPYSSKITDIELYIKNKPKILIFTKMDLCDLYETKKWMIYYQEKGYHVIGVDLTQSFSSKKIVELTQSMMKEQNEKKESKGLKKRKTRVLIVGIPNAGKSTLLNRLVGKKAVMVGNKPGITKSLSWIRINEDLELLDTPGILWPKLDQETVAFNLASLTAIKEEILPLDEIIFYILKTLKTYYPNILKERYGIEELKEDVIDTIEEIGKRRGCLIRGGEVDYDKVYGVILNDIKEGIIKGITFDRFEVDDGNK